MPYEVMRDLHSVSVENHILFFSVPLCKNNSFLKDIIYKREKLTNLLSSLEMLNNFDFSNTIEKLRTHVFQRLGGF